MMFKGRTVIAIMLLLACFLVGLVVYVAQCRNGSVDERETSASGPRRDLLASVRGLIQESEAKDLKAYEELADKIDKTWREKDRTSYALAMMNVCEPLSSGTFKEPGHYELARKYALSALAAPDEIPLIIELELIGHVTTVRIGSDVSKGEQFSKERKENVAIRLHAWKRLMQAVDPNWDPDEVLFVDNVAPPAGTGMPAGVEPEAIKDADLRKEYETLIEENRKKIEKYREQYELSKWLKRFPRRIEEEIIQAYSDPPLNVEELRAMLHEHLSDKEVTHRIVNAVEKNTGEKGASLLYPKTNPRRK